MSNLHIDENTEIGNTGITLKEIISKINTSNSNITSLNNSVNILNKKILPNSSRITVGEYNMYDVKKLITINYSSIFNTIPYSGYTSLGTAYNALKYAHDKYFLLINAFSYFKTYVRICIEYSDNFTEQGRPRLRISGNNTNLYILMDKTWGGIDDNIKRFYSKEYTWDELYSKFGDNHLDFAVQGYDLKGTTSDYYPRLIKIHRIYLEIYNKYTG